MFRALLSYFLFFEFPVIGNIEKGTILLAQAFGRNDVLDEKLGVIASLAKQNIEINILAVIAKEVDPGKSNMDLARKIIEILKSRSDLPAVIQWEIAVAIYRLNKVWYLENACRIAAVFPNGNGRFSTKDVLEKSLTIANSRGWIVDCPIVVAHEDMYARAWFLARKIFGISPISLGEKTWTHTYDFKSVQEVTKSHQSFMLYEWKVRIHHFLLGWVS